MFKDDKCRKSLHKTLLGALRRREENNIKIDLTQLGYERG